MNKKSANSKSASIKPVTMNKLGKFTDEVILPGVEKIVGEKLKHYATKADLHEFKDDIIGEVRKENTKNIQSNDRVATKLDTVINELAAHTYSHKRIDDTLLDHESRLKKVETAVK